MKALQGRNLGFAFWCGGAVLLGAFLLFQVQPIISRMILPWFGGGPAVWTACLLFFQILLLAGYAYAYLLNRFLTVGWQATVHWLLLAAALLMLPVTPGAGWQPEDGSQPVLRILLLLTAHIGLPYLLLAATAPLIQSWWSTVYNPSMPYRLYALSNAGSLVALLSYPFIVEPLLGASWQGLLWSLAFAGFALLCGSITVMLWLHQGKAAPAGQDDSAPVVEEESAASAEASAAEASAAEASAAEAAASRGGAGRMAAWAALAAAGVIVLMATTNHLSQDIAVTPLLWVAPLSLYLISFIICFDRPAWSRPQLWSAPAAVCIGLTICYSTLNLDRLVKLLVRAGYAVPPLLESVLNQHMLVEAVLWLSSMFFICMMCHGLLVQLRPPKTLHTLYYLIIAAGGAVGGITVAVLCPAVLPTIIEPRVCLAGGLIMAMLYIARSLSHTRSAAGSAAGSAAPLSRRLLRFGFSTMAVALIVIVLYPLFVSPAGGFVWRGRNFYGALEVHTVKEKDPLDSGIALSHGTTLHGFQFTAAARRRQPTTYFSRESGAGLVLDHFPRFNPQQPAPTPVRPMALRVGVIGLGAGTLAAYGRKGDLYTFYEIDQMVTGVARQQFTFLKDSLADVAIEAGDARISLNRQKPQEFNVLVLDAFSGDAIPVHLLTLEAMILYQRHLAADGVMAFHVSNRHLNLEPVVRGLAQRLEYTVLRISTDDGQLTHQTGSEWLLLSRNTAIMQNPQITSRATPLGGQTPVLWTDDHSNLLQILK